MEGSKENNYWDLGIKMVYVNFRVLEKSFQVLEKSLKSTGNLFLKKGTNPVWAITTESVFLLSVTLETRNLVKWLISWH